ncbi:major facilitator superfamily domain-containing protein [Radiomyces spectabilis]|uniref:major facilitator superfamily domain-containing protein n=1 Tax=Radiomyces spectabilis TaxID=64574 RepID=UPI002220CBCD|nr:major facilitator superfamily domain-containing protein [Radiomyces spectabilis]KAI8379713.1 major facilitator superfamily domain-containing protein [Radiomyces spectabilis]
MCISLWIGVSLSSLDSSIVATIYAQIGTEFKKSNEIIWIATSYMLSYTALQPLYGRISDVFGRKTALMFATSVFFIGSGLCGAANSLWSLVFARAVAGIGGGGINTMTTVITSDLVPLRYRGTYQGYGNIAYAVGSVVGAPLGGFITDTIGWRYCFYINLPFLLVTIYVASCLLTNYNLAEQPSTTLWERLKKIDYLGAITIVLSVIAFLLATSLGGNLRSWTDPLVVGCLVASIVLAVLFCIIEAKVALYPLMPWEIISSRTPLACSMTNLCTVMSSTSLIYVTPLYFQGLMGYSPTQAGLFFLPKIALVSTGSVLCGMWMSRTGEYRNITIVAAVMSFVSMIGFTCWTTTTPLWFLLICLLMDGFSMGVLITTTLIAMLSCVGQGEMATVTSMSYLFRSVGGVIGISATSAIFQAIVKSELSEKITGPNADKYIEIARKSMTEIRQLLPQDILQIVLETYQTALRYTFLACVIIAAFTVISTLFIQRFELHTKVRK